METPPRSFMDYIQHNRTAANATTPPPRKFIACVATGCLCVSSLVGCGKSDPELIDYSEMAAADHSNDADRDADRDLGADPGPDSVAQSAAHDTDAAVAPASDTDGSPPTIVVIPDNAGPAAVEPAANPVDSLDVTAASDSAGRDVPFPGNGGPRIAADGSRIMEDELEEEPVEQLPIKLLVPNKSFRRERGSTAYRVSYDDVDLLKILNMQPVPVNATDHFPEWLRSLDGQTVRMRGFMYPTFKSSGLEGFTMARDNGICCFVRKPKIYDIVRVRLKPGSTSDYIDGRSFDVEGTFHVVPEADDTQLYGLYRIDNARIIE